MAISHLVAITSELDWIDQDGYRLSQALTDQSEPDPAQLRFLVFRSRAIVAHLERVPDPTPDHLEVLMDARHVADAITSLCLQIAAGTDIEPAAPAC